jgi:hypothetical protein
MCRQSKAYSPRIECSVANNLAEFAWTDPTEAVTSESEAVTNQGT